MKITPSLLCISLALVVFLVAGCSAARPLHRSAASIRRSLLKRTPPGTSEQQVAAFIAREGWRIDRQNSINHEFMPYDNGGPRVPEKVHDLWSAYLGGYVYFFGTRVTYGIWAFDANGRLIDIWIYRERDGL